jgi:hypothetical protein
MLHSTRATFVNQPSTGECERTCTELTLVDTQVTTRTMVRVSSHLNLGAAHADKFRSLRQRQIDSTREFVKVLADDPETALLMLMGEVRRLQRVRPCLSALFVSLQQ